MRGLVDDQYAERGVQSSKFNRSNFKTEIVKIFFFPSPAAPKMSSPVPAVYPTVAWRFPGTNCAGPRLTIPLRERMVFFQELRLRSINQGSKGHNSLMGHSTRLSRTIARSSRLFTLHSLTRERAAAEHLTRPKATGSAIDAGAHPNMRRGWIHRYNCSLSLMFGFVFRVRVAR